MPITYSLEEPPTSGPTLCLNMIVKNESKIITRLLESVAPILDSYCICDTGSTDNTVELITEFFASRNIPGKIVKEPFRDFGYNRTFALKAAEGMPNADFLLLLDADMVLWKNPAVSAQDLKRRLTGGLAFFIYQGTDSFYYKNTRIVKNNAGVKYWGVTHEYTEIPDGIQPEQLPKDLVFINDIGDGGAKGDKYERDIRLLQKGLLEHPNNERYLFYLGNSYYNGGYPDEAAKMYKKRIEVGGWIEEVWYCHYNIGKIYREKNDMASAIWWWLEGYRRYPNRIEQLYEIVKFYREQGAQDLAYMYYGLADRARTKHSVWDYLFMEKDVYDYKLDYEFSIIGYYCNPEKVDLTLTSMKVLADGKVDSGLSKNTLSNYKFYAKKLADWDIFNDAGSSWTTLAAALASVGEKTSAGWSDRASFFKSTPSIVSLAKSAADGPLGTFLVCQRYVNYYINGNGGYEQNGDITTRNVFGLIENGILVREFELGYDKTVDGVYRGLEDVRLWTEADADVSEVPHICYSSNRGLGHSNMVVEVGEIDLMQGRTANSRHLYVEGEERKTIEKNWIVTGVNDGMLSMIYGWNPVTTGCVVGEKFLVNGRQGGLPDFFRYLRGSTNTIEVDGDLWAICHAVSYEDRRYYYHLVVVLDKETKAVKKYTPLFTFVGEKVEYTLGMVVVGERLVIGFSVMDKEVRWIAVPKFVVRDMLIVV
jgi:glycosyltransferase involved in cell wall biosynthesis